MVVLKVSCCGITAGEDCHPTLVCNPSSQFAWQHHPTQPRVLGFGRGSQMDGSLEDPYRDRKWHCKMAGPPLRSPAPPHAPSKDL